MKAFSVLMTVVLSVVLLGCGNQPGEPVEYSQVCSTANNKKYIETEGFLDDAGGVFCSNTSGRMECGFKLKNDLKDEKGFSADIAIAGGANSMDKLERGYRKSDIKIRNNQGDPVDLSKKVKVTGTLTFSDDPVYTSGPVCYLKVDKIEQ
ncbi:MAG: hypothetical protein R2747_14670 [Pyrinomonadaceae bacterium]